MSGGSATLQRARLRVALFSGNYNYLREGANQALNNLVAHLEGAGHRVRVYSPVTDTPAFAPQGTLVPVPSVTLPIRSEFQLAPGLPAAIRRDLDRFSPDLIHVSTPDILGSRAETLAKRRRIPIVASLHTRFETYLAYYRLEWLRPLVDAHLHRFYRRADCVLAPTPAIVDEMKRLRGDGQAVLWSRGVDTSLFNPSRRDEAWRRGNGWAEDDVVVLYFGRLVLEKGVDRFVEIVRELRKAGRNVRALVVGDGPERERMRSLDDSVLAGHLTGTDLARAIASADIMVSPSTTEAFGNVILEAMASGLCVISADAPSARALLAHGRTGFLCKDVGDYVETAARLIDAPRQRQRLGTAARGASHAYDWDAVSGAAEQAYLQTVARYAHGRR